MCYLLLYQLSSLLLYVIFYVMSKRKRKEKKSPLTPLAAASLRRRELEDAAISAAIPLEVRPWNLSKLLYTEQIISNNKNLP